MRKGSKQKRDTGAVEAKAIANFKDVPFRGGLISRLVGSSKRKK